MCLEGIKPTPSSLSTSTFHMCPAEDESFRQLEGHGSSVKPSPDLKPSGRSRSLSRRFLLVARTVA